MAQTLEQILGYQFLCGTIEAIKTPIMDVLPAQFNTVKESTLDDSGRYTVVKASRLTTRRTAYGSASHKRSLFPIGSRDVKLYHSFEHIDFDTKTMRNLRKVNDYQIQKQGIDEVARQAALFKRLFENTRLQMIASMLSKQAIYWDGDGNLLPTSSGATATVDYGIPAANQNQLGGIIAASWATASTDIPAHLRALDEQSVKDTGYLLKYAFYGRNLPSHLTKNDHVKDYLSRADGGREALTYLRAGQIPAGLFGLEWVPAYRLYLEQPDGTQTTWFGADQVVFTPDIAADTYALLEGTYDVPTEYGVMSTAEQARQSFKPVLGMGMFAMPTFDPMAARLFGFDTALPVWKVTNNWYSADVTP